MGALGVYYHKIYPNKNFDFFNVQYHLLNEFRIESFYFCFRDRIDSVVFLISFAIVVNSALFLLAN